MKLSVLVLIAAFAVGLSIGLVNFYFQQSWYFMLVSFVVTFITSFIVFITCWKNIFILRIVLIYKMIHNPEAG